MWAMLPSNRSTRDSWFTAREPIKNAPLDIRVEPKRRYMGVPLPQRGVRIRGTDATSIRTDHQPLPRLAE